MEVALRDTGLDNAMISAIHVMLEFIYDGAFIRDTKAMKSTPADVIELLRLRGGHAEYKADQIKVHLQDNNVLVVSVERQHREKEEGVKYLKTERRFTKLLRKFVMPENADKLYQCYRCFSCSSLKSFFPP